MQERVTQFFAAPVTFTSEVVFLKEVHNLHVQNWRNRVLPECSRPIGCSYSTDEHCEVGEENEADRNVHQLHHVVRPEPADCAYIVKGGNVELQEHPVICVATQIHLWVYLYDFLICAKTPLRCCWWKIQECRPPWQWAEVCQQKGVSSGWRYLWHCSLQIQEKYPPRLNVILFCGSKKHYISIDISPVENQNSIQKRCVREPQSWQKIVESVSCPGISVRKSQHSWANSSQVFRNLRTERLWLLLIWCIVNPS